MENENGEMWTKNEFSMQSVPKIKINNGKIPNQVLRIRITEMIAEGTKRI